MTSIPASLIVNTIPGQDILEEGPAQRTGYMALGFAVTLGTLALQAARLRSRFRNLARELECLYGLEEWAQATADGMEALCSELS